MHSLSTARARRMKLVALGALAAVLVLVAQVLASPRARADVAQPGLVGNQEAPASLSIATDRPFYHDGDWVRICYTIPGAGYIEITDHQPGGQVHTLLAGYDDGTGDCFWAVITPPFGQECLKLTYWFGDGATAAKQTCFAVAPQFPPY